MCAIWNTKSHVLEESSEASLVLFFAKKGMAIQIAVYLDKKLDPLQPFFFFASDKNADFDGDEVTLW